MSVQVHGGAAVPRITKRVFLHTGTVKKGEAVCYNYDVTDVSAENEAVLSASAAMWCDARRLMVERPSVSNHMHFAGVMIDETATGPQWIPIAAPGSVCRVYTNSTVTAGFSGTYATGQIVTFGVAINSSGTEDTTYNGKFLTGGFPGEGSAVVLAEGTASVPSDTYLKMAELMTGRPAGGVQAVAMLSQAYSAATCIMHGVIDLGLATTTTAQTAGTISIPVGKFCDQRILIKGPISAASACVSIGILVPYGVKSNISAFGGADVAAISVAGGASISLATQYWTATWNGLKWVMDGNIVLEA